MVSLKKIFGLEFNSSFLKFALGLFYKEGKSYKVIFGYIKGLRLYYRKDITYHAILGMYENESFNILTELFKKADLGNRKIVVADVGANMGYYSLFFSRFLNKESEIYAFEPSVSILDMLRKNMYINRIPNVSILDMACSDSTGDTEFYIGENHHQSSIIGEWAENKFTGKKILVKSTTLDDFFGPQNNRQYPDLIKMDIEGAGVYALKGCTKCINEKRPYFLIESHTPNEDKAIGEVLQEHDYEAYRVNTKKWVVHKNNNYKDPEGVWGSMLLVPGELRKGILFS